MTKRVESSFSSGGTKLFRCHFKASCPYAFLELFGVVVGGALAYAVSGTHEGAASFRYKKVHRPCWECFGVARTVRVLLRRNERRAFFASWVESKNLNLFFACSPRTQK